MPLDHYVSQVHLKNFASPALDGTKMYGVRKRDLRKFPCSPKDVCRIENGSTNAYLEHDRVIEEFLKEIEPRYNGAVEQLRNGRIDHDCVYVIAGFVAYVGSCAPAAMRLLSDTLRHPVAVTAGILERRGDLPPVPPELGGGSLSDLLQTGRVNIEIDGKYPQAIGISSILDLVARFGNFHWEVLINTEENSPYFTSDFPVTFEKTQDPRILNRVVPLAPDLAIRIRPMLDSERADRDINFRHFRYRIRKPKLDEIRGINALIVQCSEELVFYRDEHDWIARFIAKNQRYRLEPKTQRIAVDNKDFLWSTVSVQPVAAPASHTDGATT
ncbi:DUF4238 domain-containing protein [Microvirga sp. RSM25]|uniref:DUF4238 domain-containing protein n=1 Tax=Microvirga sp. RSM25 TaxID=3273802 RepID=UPI003850C102